MLAALVLLVAGCGEAPSDPAPVERKPWTAHEIDAVFDLAELGTDLGIDPDSGDLLLADRPLPAAIVLERPHLTMGRDRNLLGLGEDALAAMHPDAARRLRLAGPAELRDLLEAYGVTAPDVLALRRDDGVIGLAEIHALAAALDGSIGPAAAAAGPGPGTRLLHDLGLADGER